MDERLYKVLVRVAVVMVVAWVGWTIYDGLLRESAPGSHELAAGSKFLEDGQLAEALASYEAALKIDPYNLAAVRGKAQAHMRQGIEAERQAHLSRKEGKNNEADEASMRADTEYRAALAAYDDAIAGEENAGITDDNRPMLGVAYANRGILKDRMGDYRGALRDYEKSIELEPEVKEGPGFMTRFLRNQPEKQAGVPERARYLREQLAKPEEERMLRDPEADATQQAYKL